MTSLHVPTNTLHLRYMYCGHIYKYKFYGNFIQEKAPYRIKETIRRPTNFPLKGNSLKERYPQVLWSILLVGKLLQIFGFYTSGIGNLLKYIDLMHQIHRLITVAQLHVCRPVLLDVRGIVRVFDVFVQLLGLKLAV